jgi:hypothetical protein
MKRLCCALIVFVTTFAYPSLARAADAGKKPNIVFILVDNLGYGELGVYVSQFEESLKKYPPIPMGTPDPYVPPK